MKKKLFVVVLTTLSLCCHAQFVLTPSGLMTEDGAYTIMRTGTESENFEVAKKAVELAIPGIDIGELEYEKSFSANGIQKGHRRFTGFATASVDWSIEYQLKVEAEEDKISISFTKVGSLVLKRKGESVAEVFPTSGKRTILLALSGQGFVFNTNGQVARGCKPIKETYEEMANNIVKTIENNLK